MADFAVQPDLVLSSRSTRVSVKSAISSAGPFGSISRLVGPQVIVWLMASVPVGVVLGGVEIVTASVLYAVLAEFNLVTTTAATPRMTFGLNPIVALFAFTILAALLRYAGQTLPTLTDLALTGRLREAMVRNTLGGVTERSVLSVSETSHLLSSVIPRGGEFVNGIATMTTVACLLVLILGGLFRLSWQLTTIAFGFAGSLALVLFLLRRTYAKYIEIIHASLRKFNVMIIRDARNNHFLRVNGVNEKEADRMVRISRRHVQASRSYASLFVLSSNIPGPSAIFLVIGVFWLNERLAFLPVDGLVPLVYLLSRTGGSIAELSMAVSRLQRNWPDILELRKHVDHLFPEQGDALPGSLAPHQILPVQTRALRFGRDAVLSRPIDLCAGPGDFVVVSGPSGRGKTTLVMTLIGLLKPIDGTISWGGVSIGEIDPDRMRSRLGYAGPEPYLIDADIRANLQFGLQSDAIPDDDLERALRLARAEFVFDLPGGLSHELREAGEGISAGQKQRLALARCVLRRPEVLLLDEATSNIDEETEAQIVDGLRDAFPHLLVIAVSHRASLRRYATLQVEL